MTELDFIQQARWFGERRGYKASWPYVIFQVKYGKWPEKLLKEGSAKEPTEEFVDWLMTYWKESNKNRK